MNPRSAPHNSFARLSSDPNVREPPTTLAPPPPYALRAPVRPSQPALMSDPPPSPFSLEKYAASLYPPPSSSSYSSAQRDSAPPEVSRQQDHWNSTSRMYGDHPPPPPPPFSSRSLLTSSPQYIPPAPMSRIPPPPPPPFGAGGRELPAPSPSNRPGSSMSISSMLDSAPVRHPRDPGSASGANGTSPTGSYTSMTPFPPAPSPTRPAGISLLRRTSPENHQTSQAPTSRTFRANSGGTSLHSHLNGSNGSPESAKYGEPRPISQYSPQSGADLQNDWKPRQDGNSSTGRQANRTSSQPVGQEDSPMVSTDSKMRGRGKEQEDTIKEANFKSADRGPVSSFEFLGRQAQLERQQQLELDRKPLRQASPREDRLGGSSYPFLTQSSVFSEPSIKAPRPNKESVIDRLLERSFQPKSNAPRGSLSEESLHRLRDERGNDSQQTQNHLPFHSRNQLPDKHDRQLQTTFQNTTPGPLDHDRRRSSDLFHQQLRPVDDGTQNHRSMLGMINDNHKRAGRVSPLPQAVQGAQGQKRGPSSDPSIKNEFSRMFAGIGSGVGSTGLNSGASTPFPPSPKQNSEADQRPLADRGDFLDFAKSRNGTKVKKRAKRVKEDDSKDIEIIGGRSTSVKGVKRSRHSQPHHHHVNHHHHHHHLEDQNGTTPQQNGKSTTPGLRHHTHHHHRADGSIHFHPPSRSSLFHRKAPRPPSIQINNASIYETVQDLERRHLGTVLYSPSLNASLVSNSNNTGVACTSSAYMIPRYEGKENCVLTVRIPRFYLSREYRKQVCEGRAVWGTDVYSDDSDPLAAAIHAGWIRGEWADDIDISMLELNPGNDQDSKDTTYTSVPPNPLLPVNDKDLHLTLLILPPLEKYTSRVAHGIRSRPWGQDHDGLSYRIERLAWVDEQTYRGEERYGESRHKRLKMISESGPAVPPLRLPVGKVFDKAMVATAAA